MIESETFQHYQVLRRADGTPWELGRGAMGVTYKATDTSLQRAVALKVIRTDTLNNERARQRFVREARAAAGLNHPNVARVFHLGESAQSFFYAMEFIDGETLEARVRRQGPLPTRLALEIALQVANALRAAAKEGLVHRDIKPSNIMLLHEEEHGEELHVKVIDFGLAKAAHHGNRADEEEDAATITVAGFVGTPHYASPEQLDEKDLDARSDFYSLGVTLWYMLAGKPPFSGSVVQVMSQHLSRQPPFETLHGAPNGVLPLLERLLEKDPDRRPQNAGELRREIENAIVACPPVTSGEAIPARGPASADGTSASGSATFHPPPRQARHRPPASSGGLWRLLGWFLLVVGFIAIAAGVALCAWYVLGPDDDLLRRNGPSNKAPHATPAVTPTIPQGAVLGLSF